MKENKLPKKEYFLKRLQDAIANQNQGKQIYFLSRYKQQVEIEAEAAQEEIKELKRKTAPKLRGELKKKEFVFSFEGGGWNSVYAKTKRGAEKEIEKEYFDKKGKPLNSNLKPIKGSAHVTTPEEYNRLLAAFN